MLRNSVGMNFNIIRVDSYDELSKKAAEEITNLLSNKPNANLGLATGGTPIGMYGKLVKANQNGRISFRNVHTFNLDEYIGLEQSNPNSYHYFMEQTFFRHIDLPSENVHIPSGTAQNLEKECWNYESDIKRKGGIDLQVLGIGGNGHIGFNEPGTSFDSRTQIVILAESTRKANARFFDDIESVPQQAITMGIQTIFEAKQILLLAFGEEKEEPLERLLYGDISNDFPASILQVHPNVTILYGY
jgi:glucosamine-6-phosphate deaminase